jgi:Predicted site-specific integrase-resolvase
MLVISFVTNDNSVMHVLKEYENSEMSDLLTAAEVVAEFPVFSRPTLWRWAREGKLPSVLLPSKRRLYRRSDVLRLLEPQGGAENDAGSEGWSDRPLPGLESAQ